MTTVGIYVKSNKPEAGKAAARLIQWCRKKRLKWLVAENTAREYRLPGGVPESEVGRECSVMVVLGGDGTLLAAVRALKDREAPVVGVNLGGLGFLTEITKDEMIPVMDAFLSGKVRIERRSSMKGRFHHGSKTTLFTVFNDVVMAKSAVARIIDMDIKVDGESVCSIKADGLIVCTPTGSTAYSLSAGGPIVHPRLDCVTITPICPHTLTNRPFVLPAQSVIEVALISAGRIRLTLDGQESLPIRAGDRVVLEPGGYGVLLVKSPTRSYYDVLRRKLHWYER